MEVLTRTLHSTKAMLKTVIPAEVRYRGGLYKLHPDARRFIRHNRHVWRDWRVVNGGAEILVDLYNVPQTLISYSYFLNILARKLSARIKPYSTGNSHENLALRKVYESFNATEPIHAMPSDTQAARAQVITHDLLRNIRTKQDVLDLTVSGIWLGIDVYESYLRRYSQPTVHLDDPRLTGLIEEGISTALFWLDYFERHKVVAVVVSHDCYVEMNIICKVAYKHGITVYFPYALGFTLADQPFSVSACFKEYKEMFARLPAADRQRALSLGKRQLEQRLSGEASADMPYITKSSFHPSSSSERALKASNKIKVLICTHCFYDNPHAYEKMLFPDFYEWLRYLGGIAEKTDYDWYIKVHRDPLPETETAVQEILKEFPRITLIDSETSHIQLAREGLDFALTAYGTIGIEYPALGVQVINASYNPHIAYDFNWHPRSREEYEDCLLNLDRLRKPIRMEELYECYFMHYYYTRPDNLFFTSYRQFTADLNRGQQIGAEAYGYFLEQLTDVRQEEIIARIEDFIDSGKRAYYIQGPE